MWKYIFAVFSGIIFGVTLAGFVIVKIIRKKINKITNEIIEKQETDEYSSEIAAYVDECKKTTEKNLRKSFKKKKPLLIVKFARTIKEKREKKKLYNEVHTPPDEDETKEEPQTTPIEERVWYPFYLLLHSIGGLYLGDEKLAFLELNEKDVFGIIKKVTSALTLLFHGIGIQRLQKIRAVVILEAVNVVRAVLNPLNKDGIKTAYKISLQGISEFNKIKNTVSLNPFYHLRVFIRKKITNNLVIDAVNCAIDIVSIEIIKIYSEKLK